MQIRKLVDLVLTGMWKDFDRLYFGGGPAFDSSRTNVARPAVAGVLFDPQRAAAHGAAGLQSVVRLFVGLEIDDTV